MGVLGLWQILEAVGHPIKIEGLEGKRLGVDANVWLYKFIRGFREKDTGTSIDSHKLGLFNRICKLLFYKIKPVFVFDGPAPVLKRRTLERRQNIRNKQLEKVQDAAMRLLAQQLKEQYPEADIDGVKIQVPDLRSHNLVAAEKLTDEDRELFYLPPETRTIESDEEQDDEVEEVKIDIKHENPTVFREEFADFDADIFAPRDKMKPSVDIESQDFLSLPPEMRYEILQDIKESRRRIRYHDNLPDDAEHFSSFQLSRLKARRTIQEKIEQCEKDICSTYTGECGGQSVQSYRMQSDATSTMLLYKNPTTTLNVDIAHVKPRDALEESQQQQQEPSTQSLTRSPFMKSSTVLDTKTSCSTPGARRLYKSLAIDLNKPVDLSDASDNDSDGTEVIESSQTPPTKSKLKMDESGSILIDTPEIKRLATPGNKNCTISTIDIQDDSLSDNFDGFASSPEPLIEEAEISDSSESEETDCKKKANVTVYDIDSDETVSDVVSLPKSPEIVLEKTPSPNKAPTLPPVHDIADAPLTNSQVQPETEQPKSDKAEEVIPEISILEDSPRPSTSKEQPAELPDKAQEPDKQQAPASQSTTTQAPRTTTYQDLAALRDAQADTKRVTNKVTTKIVDDAKELLRLFGIPYLDATGEAEAQCALLEELNLTEGTITDDSDVWLFGAQNVYRYFFSDDKYVMRYKMKDIEFHIRMTRENLVCFAMLVGSDYTDGIMNVGPVTALEILSEFPGVAMEPLIKFKKWKDKYEKSKDRIPGSRKREKLLKYRLPDEFPSRAVFEGYMRPQADNSSEQFSWGMPELDELREYARRNFGWDSKKIDEKLLPVMKRVNERKTQPTIDSFFFKTAANVNPEMFRSKRVNEALNKIAKVSSQDEVNLSDASEENNCAGNERPSRPTKSTKTSAGKAAKVAKTSAAPKTSSSSGRRKKKANAEDTSASQGTRKRPRVKGK